MPGYLPVLRNAIYSVRDGCRINDVIIFCPVVLGQRLWEVQRNRLRHLGQNRVTGVRIICPPPSIPTMTFHVSG